MLINNIDFFNCENCDKNLCEYGLFTCRCGKLDYFIKGKHKCDLCESSSYDCECENTFTTNCLIK